MNCHRTLRSAYERKKRTLQTQVPDALLLFQVIEYNPSQCLDWLAGQTPRNKLAHSWVLQNMENWVERFLLAHNYPRVRTCTSRWQQKPACGGGGAPL